MIMTLPTIDINLMNLFQLFLNRNNLCYSVFSLARQRAVVADLTFAKSIEEFQNILRTKMATLKDVGPYLEGAMWDQESFNTNVTNVFIS